MNFRKPLLAGLALLLVLSMTGDVLADISNAAVLFLRIAPGSRAAGMGEAYVAVADDATATHWNPAGLGSHPLSDTWIESKIPERFLPVTGFAPLSTGKTRNYLDYDIWAITKQGLIRYDNKKWHTEEVFSTRTDETVEGKVRKYFRTTDDDLLAAMIEQVARVNNRGTYDELVALKEQVLPHIPAEYDRYENLKEDLDSLLASYLLCRVNWDKVREARERFADGMKDSSLQDTEIDRVAVALEHARNRFLPEELRIPYNIIFSGKLTSIASTGQVLLVGSTDGLARFNGTEWEISYWEDGGPVKGVTVLQAMNDAIIVGSSEGLGVFRGLSVSHLTTEEASLPSGPVQAVGGRSVAELYAAVNGRLYRLVNRQWSDSWSYTVGVDDSLDKIADRFSIYGTDQDRQRFITLYTELQARNQVADISEETAVVTEGEEGADKAEVVTPSVGVPGLDAPLVPGQTIQVPILASIKGRATALHVDAGGQVWLGTDHGVFYYDSRRWIAHGYEDHEVVAGETIASLAAARRSHMDEASLAAYESLLRDINDLGEAEPEVGSTVRLYANPAGQPVNSLGGDGRLVSIATRTGLIKYNDGNWVRSSLRGLTRANIIGLYGVGNESWVASDERIVIKGRGHSELSLMHVNWLPELADDLYYEFFSLVSPKKGWGTFGGSITFISYGKFVETDAFGNVIGDFDSYDYAIAGSYGVSLTNKLKGGISAKFIYSRLAPQGQGKEQGTGTASGFAIDVGLLYHMSSRLTWGMALTNLGPKLTYIDAAQSDDLPRNLAIGLSYKLLRSDYIKLLTTIEVNKLLVGLDDQLSEEARQSVINGGAEFTYADMFSARVGYIYDQEGDIKTPTLGFGLSPVSWGEFDFAYIPSQDDFSLANTLRISLRIIL